MIKNQQAYDQALEEIVDNNDDIKALKNIVDQIASELLDGDPNDTLSLLEFCVEEAPYAAWALINSPVAFKPLLNIILKYDNATDEQFDEDDHAILTKLSNTINELVEDGMWDNEVVTRNFRYIELISSEYICDDFYVHYLGSKLTIYAQREHEVLESGFDYGDFLSLYAITTECCDLEMNLTDDDLYVFVKLGRYGIKEEQWDKIHEQWF